MYRQAMYRQAMRRAALVAILLSLAACAPVVQPRGVVQGPPTLDTDAVVAEDAYRLPLRAWQAKGKTAAVIVALHGFNDYSNGFDGAAKDWAARGITTYAYDQRGFGRSKYRGIWAGVGRMVKDAAAVTAVIRARHPKVPIYHVGVSMGAAVLMIARANGALRDTAGLILVAPAVWGRSHIPFYYRLMGKVAAYTVPWLRLGGRGFARKPSDNVPMMRKMSADPLVIKTTRVDAVLGLVNLMDAAASAASRLPPPFLVLYGERDRIVEPKPFFAMVKRLPERATPEQRIAIYRDGYHMLLRDLKSDVVRKDIVAWIADRRAPLPSKFDRAAAKLK